MISYRADIDGLRALAVLPVVLFHLGAPWLRGGFVGVDVFFVISGYLITSIIIAELDKGEFSLLRFYQRRARRILPALFTVLAVCTLAAYFILFPSEFEYYGQTLSATAGFGSNILFWKKSGYFEMESALVPLLHTWSLAVEEQYYILFPLYLMIVHRFARKYITGLTALCLVLSLVISVAGLAYAKYSAVFYLLPPRAWELLMGSVLALSGWRGPNSRAVANVAGILGIAAILYAVFRLDEESLFPGLNALYPCIGATLIIISGLQGTSWSSKILGTKPFVAIGKISYSLYLWHWPLIVFYNYASPVPLAWQAASVIFIVALTLSYLSWRFIEQPVRQNKALSQRKIFTASISGSLFFIVLGLGISYAQGLPVRFPEDVRKLAAATIGTNLPPLKHLGFEGFSGALGGVGEPVSFVVWGDSHAQATAPAIDALAHENKSHGYLLEDSGCLPTTQNVSFMEAACNKFNQQVLEFLKKQPEINKVILIAYWSAYAARLQNKPDGVVEPNVFSFHMEKLFKALKDMGKDVYFVMEIPAAPVSRVPLYLARAKYYGQSTDLRIEREDHIQKQQQVLETLAQAGKVYDVKVLKPHEILCGPETCEIIRDGQPLYYDDDHLSTFGALKIKDFYKPLFP